MIQYLEARHSATRTDVHLRDIGSETAPDARVEMTFRLSGRLYAIEHTGIEPFDGFMAHQNRAADLFEPIAKAATAALGELLVLGVVIELHVPIDGLIGRKTSDVRAIQAALVERIAATTPALPARRYAEYRGTLTTAQPEGVPFSVSVVRFDGLPSLPGSIQIKHLASGAAQQRTDRIARACGKKFPKLARWKQSADARTILVLEDNDVQLTNEAVVADTCLPIARGRSDAPDETYLVSTWSLPWHGWPLLVDGRDLFDFAQAEHPICFEVDTNGRLIKPAA